MISNMKVLKILCRTSPVRLRVEIHRVFLEWGLHFVQSLRCRTNVSSTNRSLRLDFFHISYFHPTPIEARAGGVAPGLYLSGRVN